MKFRVREQVEVSYSVDIPEKVLRSFKRSARVKHPNDEEDRTIAYEGMIEDYCADTRPDEEDCFETLTRREVEEMEGGEDL